jgi:hypothetical protein
MSKDVKMKEYIPCLQIRSRRYDREDKVIADVSKLKSGFGNIFYHRNFKKRHEKKL